MKKLLKKLPLHFFYIVLWALINFAACKAVFGGYMTTTMAQVGWQKAILPNLSAGACLYFIFSVIREQIREKMRLSKQLKKIQFRIKLLKMADPMGMAMANVPCGVNNCNGFLAKASDRLDREGIFCIQCDRTATLNEFNGLRSIGTRFSFE